MYVVQMMIRWWTCGCIKTVKNRGHSCAMRHFTKEVDCIHARLTWMQSTSSGKGRAAHPCGATFHKRGWLHSCASHMNAINLFCEMSRRISLRRDISQKRLIAFMRVSHPGGTCCCFCKRGYSIPVLHVLVGSFRNKIFLRCEIYWLSTKRILIMRVRNCLMLNYYLKDYDRSVFQKLR